MISESPRSRRPHVIGAVEGDGDDRVGISVTTTHDPGGGGRPRLFFPGDNPSAGELMRVFFLRVGWTTVLGGGPASHLLLDGLSEPEAEVQRDRRDEYELVRLGSAECRVDGRPVFRQRLRTGSRIQIGQWTMIYFREEFADHGRPHGGRIGGEAGHQEPQDIPVYDQPRPDHFSRAASAGAGTDSERPVAPVDAVPVDEAGSETG